METYGYVARDVAPKRQRLKSAQDNLAKKQAALASAQEQLAGVLAKVRRWGWSWGGGRRLLIELRGCREDAG
jgi:hypothetical protein